MLDELDRELLDAVQEEIPLTKRPFQVLAERLGTDEATVLERLSRFRQQGMVRRIGAFLDAAKLGYVSVLAGVETTPEKTAAVAAIINSFPGVTHNYEREHRYNLWFTLASPDSMVQSRILQYISRQPGVLSMVIAPPEKRYKIHVHFKV